jgi:phytoene desaturase
MSSTKSVAVIGAGIAGIASAIRMAVRGHKVTVFESNAYAGGKIAELRKDGFRWDMGPSLFTLPELVDELFTIAGKNPRDYFKYRKLDIVTRYFFAEGSVLTAWSDPEKFAEELASVTGEDKKQVTGFLRRSGDIYDLTHELFLESSIHKAATYFRGSAFRSLLRLPRLKVFTTMHKANAAAFTDARTVQLFDRFATYNGSDPYQAPATLNVIPHLEHQLGAYFPEGGMHSIVNALVQLAQDCGVNFRFNSPVEKIVAGPVSAMGVKVKGAEILFDIIICNTDVRTAYATLLKGGIRRPARVLSQPPSSSALIFYWGISRTFPQLDLHNIFFSSDYPAEFRAIFAQKTVPDAPTVYLYISSKTETGDAPAGKENWFAMINVPSDEGQDWAALQQKARKAILARLSATLGTEVERLIECETILDPQGIEARTGSAGGAIYGNSSNNKFSAFLRHANFTSSLRNLYFCGGSVHPGGGIPLCLLSSRIVDELIPQ